MDNTIYMERCLGLARLGAGYCAPNPLVGAVLVNKNRIIGEGWHKAFGGPHAEVNCLDSVTEADKKYISSSELYVSLEPCAHFGKTPPCTDLIIKNKIPTVIVACRDPFDQVNGKGIEKLRLASIQVEEGMLKEKSMEVNKRFFCFHEQHRPYMVLKWAESADGFMGDQTDQRLRISNEFTNRLVHKWRSEEAAILVGTNTALLDNPELTNRLWTGLSPVRVLVDLELKLPSSHNLFNKAARTIIFNSLKHEENGKLDYFQVTRDVSLPLQIVNALYRLNIQSVMIEGGAKLLQSFIDEDLWDEARVIRNKEMFINRGIPAPQLDSRLACFAEESASDMITTFQRIN